MDIIHAIFDHHKLGIIDKIIPISQGVGNNSYQVNQSHIVRLHQNNERFLIEAYVYSLLSQSSVPVPQVLAVDTSKSIAPVDYIVTSRLPGSAAHPTSRTLLPAQQVKLGHQIGQALATIHTYSFDDFGTFHLDGTTQYQTWWDYFQNYVTIFLQDKQSQAELLGDLLFQIGEIVNQRKHLFEQVSEPCLIHGDYHLENILQEAGNLTGIVDMEWTMAGDFAFDFAVDYHWRTYSEHCLESIYKGYTAYRALSPADRERITVYKLFPMLDNALYAHEIGWFEGRGWHWAIKQVRQQVAAFS